MSNGADEGDEGQKRGGISPLAAVILTIVVILLILRFV